MGKRLADALISYPQLYHLNRAEAQLIAIDGGRIIIPDLGKLRRIRG
ncbi:hypothetical protein [Hymenobacter algoricola]|uniref:Uncharacterized protein n=1 Tax=Hymenobacter algoricola TaxID=486267 RepID=A0ABP7MH19_9BACT